MSSEDLIVRQYRNRIRKRVLSTLLVGLILCVLVILDIQIGSSSIVLKDLIEAVLEGPEGGSSASFIVWEIRLPMTFTCLFVGASLSLAGLLIQTITNNPLASPYTLGVTAGASFGAAIAITTGFALFGQIWLGVSLAALVMALTVSAFIFYLGSKRSLTATTLILVGVIMNFFFQALQQYLQYRASPEIAQIISGWTFGNLQRSSWISTGVSSTCWTIVLLIFLLFVETHRAQRRNRTSSRSRHQYGSTKDVCLYGEFRSCRLSRGFYRYSSVCGLNLASLRQTAFRRRSKIFDYRILHGRKRAYACRIDHFQTDV